jgi:hypothetical protein
MDTKNKTPWQILGIEKGASWDTVRAAFLKNARRLHPDKGGDHSQFQELKEAYESLKEVMNEKEEEQEVLKEFEKWIDWAGRWGKRFFETKLKKKEVLRICLPWKILEDRTQTIRIEYDGWPINIPLSVTNLVGAFGLKILLIPSAEYKTSDGKCHKITCDPWRTDENWLFVVPGEASSFCVSGGEWMNEPGDYGRGVFWRK